MNKKKARKFNQKREKERFKGLREIEREKQYRQLVREITLRFPTKEEFDRLRQTTSRHECEMCDELIEAADFRSEQFVVFAVGKVRPGVFIESELYFAHRKHFEKAAGEPVENYAELREQFQRKILKKEFRFRGFNFEELAPPSEFSDQAQSDKALSAGGTEK